MSDTEYQAQRYLHACINAVAVAAINSGMTSAFDGQSCSNPAFDIAQFFDGKFSTPAVAASRIEFGSAGLEDFKIEVTDRGGKTWTGSLDNYPKIAPRKSPLTPQQLAQAQAAAYQVAAQNVARSCVTALEQYKMDNLERSKPGWNGKSCAEAGLVAASSGAAIEKSQITFHPNSLEGYQVTVWPKLGGEVIVMPAKLTPKPTKWQEFVLLLRNNPGQVFNSLIISLIEVGLLFLCTFKWPSNVKVGGGGIFVVSLILGVLGLLIFSSQAGHNLGEVGSYLALALVSLLASGLLFAVPRLVYWFGREAWWVSLGTGTVAGLGSLAALWLLASELPYDIFSVSFISFPFLSLLVTLYTLWQRWRNRRSRSLS